VPQKELIIALHNSNLASDLKMIHLLWKEQEYISEKVIDLLLSALEIFN
jgi:hypothetical protein